MGNLHKPGIEADTKAALGFDVYTAIISKLYVNVGGGRDTMIGIGKNSKNPELAIKLIEQMNTNKELYNLISFGIEGKHYKKLTMSTLDMLIMRICAEGRMEVWKSV